MSDRGPLISENGDSSYVRLITRENILKLTKNSDNLKYYLYADSCGDS